MPRVLAAFTGFWPTVRRRGTRVDAIIAALGAVLAGILDGDRDAILEAVRGGQRSRCRQCPAGGGASARRGRQHLLRRTRVRGGTAYPADGRGPWPGRPGHLIANGGFKIGFAMAPAVAGMVADLLLEGRDHIPPAFRPENG